MAPRRRGSDPKRRIAPADGMKPGVLDRLAETARYVGSAHHKRWPADYGFHPPVSPRRNKSVCDAVRKAEAESLFREGVRRRMVSGFLDDGLPKYIWAVSGDGRVYEAVLGRGGEYHGYRLGGDDPVRREVIEEWRVRRPTG